MNEMANKMPAVNREIEELTPAELGGEIRLLTSQARRMALSFAIQIGYRLKIAHEKVGPHKWAEWLKAETEFSAAAASRFEKLYEGYGQEQGSLFGVGNKFPTLENLSVSNALRLLAVPEEEREEVAAEVDAEHISARELERVLAERDAALFEAEAARNAVSERDEAREKLAQAERQIKELESRPIDVAVERDEEAVQRAAEEARKAAEEAARAELDKLKAKLARAEQSEKAAKEALETAKAESGGETAKAQEEAERARAEAEELRRKLRASETGAGEAALLAKMAQANFMEALEKIRAMREPHPETAEKLLAGMEQIARAMLERVQEVKG